jgi:hypothetical protein
MSSVNLACLLLNVTGTASEDAVFLHEVPNEYCLR